MRNFQEKRGWKNIIESKPVLIILGILILIFAYSVLGFWNKMLDSRRSKKIVEDKVNLLEERKDSITKEIESLNTDEGKEKVFRENLGLVKEGEGLVVIVEDKNSSQNDENTSSSGFFSFLKNLFK